MSLDHDLVGLALEPKCWHGAWYPVSFGRLLWSILTPTHFVHQDTRATLLRRRNSYWDHPNPCLAPCSPLGAKEQGHGPLGSS